jgi:membrane protein implicated in regulation of membrane protease activity
MSMIPFWSESPSMPSRRFLRWFAIVLLVSSAGFIVGYGFQLAFVVVGGIFVLGSLALVIYAWRFAPANLGQPQGEPLVRSGQLDTTSA